MTPRGIRNRNPGNIDYAPGVKWLGLDDPPSDGRFCRFTDAVFGIRALCKVLLAYQRKHKLLTVRQIINRWAPPSENDTGAYVASVAKRLGVEPDAPLSLETDRERLASLAEAIITHENGEQPYTRVTIDLAINMALS